MSMKEQRDEWIKSHPDATIKEAFEAGYFTSTENLVKQKR